MLPSALHHTGLDVARHVSSRSAGDAHAAPATLAAGGSAKVAADIFRKHDSDGSGLLEGSEVVEALQELGVLEGLRAQRAGGGLVLVLVLVCWCWCHAWLLTSSSCQHHRLCTLCQAARAHASCCV